MHIPDGYLSPQTCAVMFASATPFWYQANRKVKEVLNSRAAPFLAVFAAFSFVIQMFNIPIPGGTTAHAVGGVLMAIVLGPWAAVIGVSTALVIQAIFFGDGGITAIGANCFNMAVALPLAGYAAYSMVAGKTPSPKRRVVAAALGGYVGINAAALMAGLELGLQPLLFSESGKALYNPYGLSVTVPAMMLVHLTIAGFAEAAITGLTVGYLVRSHPEILEQGVTGVLGTSRRLGKLGWALIAALGVLVVLTPIGLLAPGGADFEWAPDELQNLVGYLPAGLENLNSLWSRIPLPDYQLPGFGGSAAGQALGYILSAVVGAGLITTFIFGIRMVGARRRSSYQEKREPS